MSDDVFDFIAAAPCRCFDCLNKPKLGLRNPALAFMIVCPKCGNKRCPRATNHANACTGSNEPDQPGSRYGGMYDPTERCIQRGED